MTTRLKSTSEWPVTVSEAKLRLRIDVGDDDADLQNMIEAATRLAESETRRAIALNTYELRLDAFPDVIRLLHPPVGSVTHVKYIDEDDFVITMAESAYALDLHSEPSWILPAVDTEWPTAKDTVNAIEVEYVAGYGTAAPQPIKQYILLVVGDMYKNRELTAEKPHTALPWASGLLDSYKLWEV